MVLLETAGGIDRDRRAAGRAFDGDAERLQRLDQRLDRSLAHVLVAIDDVTAMAEGESGGQERVAVPALPRKSGAAGALSSPELVTTKVVASGSSTLTPIWRSASAM